MLQQTEDSIDEKGRSGDRLPRNDCSGDCAFGSNYLYARRVQHNSDLSSNCLRRQISSESASNNAVGSMSSANLAPVHSELVSVLIGGLGLGDEGNTLSKVEVNLFLTVNSLDFDKTDTVVLVAKTALVTKDGTVNVKLWGSHIECVLKTAKETIGM